MGWSWNLSGHKIKIKTKRTAAAKYTTAYTNITNKYNIIILDFYNFDFISMLKPGSRFHSENRYLFGYYKNNYLYILKYKNKMVYDVNDGVVQAYLK